MDTLETRLVAKLCELFGDLIEARQSGDFRAFNDAEKSLRVLGEIAGAELMHTFRREVISRIGEVAPQAAQRILDRLSGRGLFGEEAEVYHP